MRWLQTNVPAAFWTKFKDYFDQINIDKRAELVEINRKLHYKDSKSFGKHGSYSGGVKVPEEFPRGRESFVCPYTGDRYLDVTNAVYTEVFRLAWPTALPGFTNKETVGDVLEALLGYWYQKTVVHKITPEPTALAVIDVLTTACFARYARFNLW